MADALRREESSWAQGDPWLAAAVLDAVASLVIVLDREGRIAGFNRACERLTGYSAAEVRGRVVWELFPVPEETEAVRAAFVSLLASRAANRHENHWRARDGEVRAISWSDVPLPGAAGEVEYVVGTGADVTERRWAEEDLLRNNQALRTLIEASPLGVVVLDREGVVRVWSPAAERIFGWSRREVVGRFLPVVPADRHAEFRGHLRQTFAGHPLAERETVRQRKDGSAVDVAIWTALLRGPQDEPESLLSVVADIGERKRAEEALRRREEQLRLFTDSAPALISYVDAEERYRFVNRQYEVWFGLRREEIHGKTVRELLGEAVYGELRPYVEAALAGRRVSYETWLSYPGVGRRFIQADYVADRDETGAVRGFFALVFDLTDRKRTEEELASAKAAVEAASQAKDHFLAVLSHELRTPLTPVLAAVSTLAAQPGLTREARESLSMVRRNVELEARLIDDLLDLTRVARGKLELHPQWVDAWEILGHAIHICCAREVAAGRRRLELGLAPGDYRVWADGPRLTQVFWNLLNNAVKFTPEGGTITVRSEIEEGAPRQLVVEVSDTGIGIEPEMLPRVFDAFEQADRRITRRFGGLGLGLTVSRAIVELLGGRLTAASAGRGHGATFVVRLPVGAEAPYPDTAAAPDSETPAVADADLAAAAPAPPPPAPGRGLRLLLVEDHADTAVAMADLLALLGHQVTIAGSVGAAREAAAAGRFDLLVSDLGLPDGSGNDLMRELAGRYGLRGIALSGYGMEEDVRQSLEAGFRRHLTKPVTLQTLAAAVREVAGEEG